MEEAFQVPLFDLVRCVSEAIDHLVSTAVVNHHLQVAYVALSIGIERNASKASQHELAMAGALHGIGASSLQDRSDIMRR
jgi:response regulator RpfG family c-di-GMP phosphodiesterase